MTRMGRVEGLVAARLGAAPEQGGRHGTMAPRAEARGQGRVGTRRRRARQIAPRNSVQTRGTERLALESLSIVPPNDPNHECATRNAVKSAQPTAGDRTSARFHAPPIPPPPRAISTRGYPRIAPPRPQRHPTGRRGWPPPDAGGWPTTPSPRCASPCSRCPRRLAAARGGRPTFRRRSPTRSGPPSGRFRRPTFGARTRCAPLICTCCFAFLAGSSFFVGARMGRSPAWGCGRAESSQEGSGGVSAIGAATWGVLLESREHGWGWFG